jgi:hypothetical protein
MCVDFFGWFLEVCCKYSRLVVASLFGGHATFEFPLAAYAVSGERLEKISSTVSEQ